MWWSSRWGLTFLLVWWEFLKNRWQESAEMRLSKGLTWRANFQLTILVTSLILSSQNVKRDDFSQKPTWNWFPCDFASTHTFPILPLIWRWQFFVYFRLYSNNIHTIFKNVLVISVQEFATSSLQYEWEQNNVIQICYGSH